MKTRPLLLLTLLFCSLLMACGSKKEKTEEAEKEDVNVLVCFESDTNADGYHKQSARVRSGQGFCIQSPEVYYAFSWMVTFWVVGGKAQPEHDVRVNHGAPAVTTVYRDQIKSEKQGGFQVGSFE